MSSGVAWLQEEYAALDEVLRSLSPVDWSRRTSFYDWTIADEVMHLTLVEEFGQIALKDPDAFRKLTEQRRGERSRGVELSQVMRERYGELAPDKLLAVWLNGCEILCGLFEHLEPSARMCWFGPDMAVSSFIAARQMETWAHGQDILDALRIRRANTDRIYAICDLGVRTQGWSFRNRGLERPPPPKVALISPSGIRWNWNDGAREQIFGSAEDFALVVTQRRNVEDTGLTVIGAGAKAWMQIAQCFAGDPEEPPPPGFRVVDFE